MTDDHSHLPDLPGDGDAHDGHGGELVPDEPIANPGLPEHEWRPTDVDPKAEKRAERQVATLFGLSAICAVLFVVAYFAFEVNGGGDGADGGDDLRPRRLQRRAGRRRWAARCCSSASG